MSNISDLLYLYMDGFNDSKDYAEYFINGVMPENRIIYYEDGKPVSSGYIVIKKAQIFNKVMDIGYLSALSTVSNMRGKNKILYIIKQAYSKLYADNISYVMLNPFDFKYYTKYGFVNISYMSKRFFSGKQVFETRTIKDDDENTMLEIEYNMTKRFNNYLIPSLSNISYRRGEYLADGNNGKIVLLEGKPIAYLFCEDGEIAYSAYSDSELFFSGNLSCNDSAIDYYEESLPYVQGRIINVVKALENYDYSFTPDIIKRVSVTDNIIMQNNVNLCITVNKGKAKIALTQEKYPQIDIAQLTDFMFNGGFEIFAKQKNLFKDKY